MEVYVDNIYFSEEPLSTSDFALSTLKLYPNPAANYFEVETEHSIDSLKIFNLLGQEMISVENETRINISSLQTGSYLVQISSGDKKTTKRLIVK